MNHSRQAHFGIIMVSASVEYKFSVSDSGTAAVDEWDANRRTEIRLFTHKLSSDTDTSMNRIAFRINVHFRNFEFYINEKLMGEGILETKGWRDIRLFTTTSSSVAVDYLRIKKVE
jgi:predicted transcriptional regulator